ncbi:transcription factor MYB3R-2-like isoform X3 [Musa acuminata AAA Group]|uniref:transcription factor MYB3R-2-like isoform X3 n=1 Tax=Musa acuminata AAA Group TaxID=214697 RepID=UPI0031D2829D
MVEELDVGEAKAERAPEVPPSFSSPVPPRKISGPTRRSTKGGWTNEEDAILSRAVKQFDGRNWKRIAEAFPGRTDIQCLHRWQKVLNPELVKGSWTKEEDECIIKLVAKHGCKRWSIIAKSLSGRIGKQCRERAENSIKNHWNCSLKKKLASYLSSKSFDQPSGVIALNLEDCIQKVGCLEADSSEQGILGFGSHFTANAAVLDHQNPSKRALDASLRPLLGGVSRCFRVNNQSMTLEDSRFLDIEMKVISTRCRHMTEVNNSTRHLNFSIDESPGAIAQTAMSCSSCERSCHESDTWHRDGSARGNASDLQNCSTIQSEMNPSSSNHLCSDDHSYTDKSNIPGFGLSNNDGGRQSDLVPGTYLHVQVQDIMVSTSSEERAVSNGHIQQNHSSGECSTPPNHSQSLASIPVSPASFLRSAAKSFKNTPSILRRRKHESSKQLFVDC